MQRFIIKGELFGMQEYILKDDDIYYQLTKVLRAKNGDEIIFFNGVDLKDYVYKIGSIDKKHIICSFQYEIEKKANKKNISLYQAFPNKIDKIELILQKGTEVGIEKFIFFRSERSQEIKFLENKMLRFEKIIQEACEQSNRNTLPELIFVSKKDILDISWENIFFHTDETQSISLAKCVWWIGTSATNINIFIWPEWWFSDAENDIFTQKWFKKVYLWNNILRTETTWIVVAFYFLHL